MNNHTPSIEKVKDFKGTLKKLVRELKVYKKSIIIVIIFALGSTIFSIAGPKILGNATTELFAGLMKKVNNTGGIDFSAIHKILLTVLILYIISAICAYIQGYIVSGVTQKFTYKIRKNVSKKIDNLPISYFDKKSHGEVLSVITNDIDTISQSLSQGAAQIITSVTTVIGILIMMITIDPIMTLISLTILPISGIIISKVVKKSQKHFKNQQDYLGHVNGEVEEMFSGQNIIKVFNAEDKMISQFEKDNDILHDSAWKSEFLSGLMQPIMVFIGNIGYVAFAIVGGYFVIIGRISVGDIQSFISYSKQFIQPMAQLAQISNMLQAMMASSERVFEFLEEEEETANILNPVSTEKIKGNVEFKNVNFGYKKNQTIINDFSATVKKGQKIAIVGPTGAGKTTLIKLLMRFYNVNEGSILIDGNNINDFNRSELREVFGMVLQDTWLFNGTIMDNLRYGKLNSTDDEVIEAAKTAHVHHFIQTLPDGYNMQLNEEASNISGGQKQLLTIARAILVNPKVLILDEATSSVDTRTEILIQKAMDTLMKGRTTFVIAHRLSTIKDADLILVMDKGDIVEQGNHNELIKKDGFYANLYNSQFEKLS